MICYDEPENPFQDCWTYLTSGDGMMGWLVGDRANPTVALHPTDEVATSDRYFGV